MFRVVRVASYPFFIPAVVISSFFVLIWVMSTANSGPEFVHHHHQRHLDAIFVLSGGHDENGQPPEWTVRRVEKAYELLVTSQGGGEPFPKIVCVGGGGAANPPMLNEWGFWVPECSLCTKYLHEKKDVDYDLLLREYTSHETLGNGFFSLLNHALPAGWRHLAIVTSEFHMPRAKVIFEYVYGLPGAGVGHGTYSKVSGSKAQGFFLEYHDVSDEGFNKTALQRAFPYHGTLLHESAGTTFYYVGCTGMSLNGKDVSAIPPNAFDIVSSGVGGIIFDFGTTFTALWDQISNPLVDALVQQISNPTANTSGSLGFPLCYDSRWSDWVEAQGKGVPIISFQFANTTGYDLLVDTAWIQADDSTVCLQMQSTTSNFNIFGNTQQVGYHIVYDLGNEQIGFVQGDCVAQQAGGQSGAPGPAN